MIKNRIVKSFIKKSLGIFKNNYFENLRTAASKVKINHKWNLRKQVFCKTDVLEYSLFQGVSFLMKLHALKSGAQKHENYASFA